MIENERNVIFKKVKFSSQFLLFEVLQDENPGSFSVKALFVMYYGPVNATGGFILAAFAVKVLLF